ncbi:MAG: response regulator [Leptospiraceae bacterium]|nr:response regulator [Leptospiraceae bacterium]
MNILLVDPSKSVRKGLKEMLQDLEVVIFEAGNATECLVFCDKEQMGIVVLSIELDDYDGYQTCKMLREKKADDQHYLSHRAQVIFITANDTMENRIRGFNAGGSNFLEKAELMTTFTQTIREIIEPVKKLSDKEILLVEDSVCNQILISNIMEKSGAETEIVSTIREAWEKLTDKNFKPSIIITDLNLPDGTGLQLLKKIKFTGTHAEIPVIVLTGAEDKDTIIQIYKEGASDYIRKPFIKEELIARVLNHLKKNTGM